MKTRTETIRKIEPFQNGYRIYCAVKKADKPVFVFYCNEKFIEKYNLKLNTKAKFFIKKIEEESFEYISNVRIYNN